LENVVLVGNIVLAEKYQYCWKYRLGGKTLIWWEICIVLAGKYRSRTNFIY
jgi:hypothetical protein